MKTKITLFLNSKFVISIPKNAVAFVIFLAFASGIAVFGQSQGPLYPGTGSNVGGIGTVAWLGPGNVVSNNNSYTNVALNNSTSNYLRATNFGFTLPANAFIVGITANIGRFQNLNAAGNDIRDLEVKLVYGGSTIGNNKANLTLEWPTSETIATYGSATDFWGATITPDMINDPSFGISIVANSTNSRIGYVDYVNITVTYVTSPCTFLASGTFTIPSGVTCIKVEAWGGGGAGGAATGTNAAGGGGGGGGYASRVLPGLSGTYPVTVGAVKLGTNTNVVNSGNPSYFGALAGTQVYAAGGLGGVYSSSNNTNRSGGLGGSANVGSTVYNGGNGTTGNYNPPGTPGGAGGGGAGSTGPGKNGITGTGGLATAVNGGAGANGVAGNSDGADGSNYGGGGSGGKANSSTDRAGGDGAQGLVIISFAIVDQPSVITGDTPVCAGTSQTYSVTDVSGITYNWSFPAGWSITAGQGTHSVTVTVGANDGDVEVTPSVYCDGPSQTLAVTTVDGVPDQPASITGTDTACKSSTWTYSVPDVSGITYTWTCPLGSSIISGQGTNSVSIKFGATSGNITVTPSNLCGDGTPQTLAIIIQTSAPAKPSIITGPASPCQGTSQTYSVTHDPFVSIYYWSIPSDWIITSGEFTNSITVSVGTASGDISVAGSNFCGSGNARTLAVVSMATIPGQPVFTNGDAAVCIGSDQYYTVSDTPYTTYTWNIPGDWILISGQGTNQIHVTPGATSGNVEVTPSNGCGDGPSETIAVTVDLAKPAQPVAINGNNKPCQASSQTYSVANVAGVSYQWTIPADWTLVSGQGSNSIDVTVGATSGDVTVIASNSCGNAMDQMLGVTVRLLPAQPGLISGSTIICEGSITSYSITQVIGVTYTWTVPAGWTINSGQGTNNVSVTIGANSGDIEVTPENACGNGTSRILNVSVDNKPPADAGPDRGICAGASINIGAPAIPGNTYSWTSNPAGFSSTNANPLVQPDTTTSYYLVETVTATGCTNTDLVVVTVNQIISVNITPPFLDICTGTTTNITLSSNISGTTFAWTASLISGSGTTGFMDGSGSNIIQTIENTSGSTAIVEYSIEATADVCVNTLNFIDVGIKAAPSVSDQTKTVCSDIPTSLTLDASTNGVAALSYNIIDINSNGLSALAGNPLTGTGFSNSIIADDAWSNTTYDPVDVIYTIVPVGTECPGPSFTVTITVKPKPQITNPSPQLICSGTSPNIELSATLASTFSWTLGAITGGVTGASAGSGTTINQVLTNPDNTSAGFVPYIITPVSDDGSCAGSAYTLTVIVKPLPVITNSSTKNICSGGGTDIILTASVASSFSWTLGAITGGITGASAGSGSDISQVLTNPSHTTAGTVKYNISATSSLGCDIAAPYTITVTVNPLPTATAGASVSDVCPGINFNLTSSSNIYFPSTLLSENFNTTNSWTRTNSSTGGTIANAAWALKTDGYSSNSQTFHSNDNSQFYVSDSYFQNGTVTNTTLTSPSVNTTGYTSLTLDFWHYYDFNNKTSEAAKVQVSTNGTVWTDIAAYTSDQGSVNNFAHPSINLNAYVGNATLYIRYYYYAGSNRGRYWAIDNVTLSGTSATPDPTISWTSDPAGYYSNVANPTNVVQTVTSNYYVTYTNSVTGCSATALKRVTCYPSPEHTILARYCAIPGHIELRDSIIGGTGTYLWSTTETTQIIAIDIAGVYSVTATNTYGCSSPQYIDASDELVVDGTFTNFDPSYPTFTTGYNQHQSYYNHLDGNPTLTGLWPEGDYAVNTTAWYDNTTKIGYHPNFHGRDHTNNSVGPRNFLMINGATTAVPLQIIWQQTVAVMPNTDYYFSAWAMNLNNVSPARLQFEVNGVLVGTVADLNIAPKPNSEGQVGLTNWVRFYSNPMWNSGSAIIAQIRIVNLNTVAGGNDFGLDDISFGTLAPIPFTINPATSSNICEGQTIDLNSNISGGRSPIVYTWTGPLGFTSHLPNPTIPDATLAHSGVYTLAVTDGYGCDPVVRTINVVVNRIPAATISGTAQVCQYGIQPNITFTGSLGTAPYTFTYKINSGADLVVSTTVGNSVTVPVPTNLPGAFTYSLVSVTSNSGCSQIQNGSATVTVNSLPACAITGDNPVCPGSVGTPYSATAGFPIYSWSITGQGTIVGPVNTEIISVNAGATNHTSFTLTLIVTDANGCNGINEVEMFIQDTAKPTLTVPPSPQDRNVEAGTCSYITGANEFDPISFDDNCIVASVTNNLNGTNTLAGYEFPSGITLITWTVTDFTGNSITKSINVRVYDDEPPVITCPLSAVVCANNLTTYINSTNLLNAVATDNCSIASLTYTLSGATTGSGTTLNGVTFHEGITNVRWRAFDVSGNSSYCDLTVTVHTQPTITLHPQDKYVCPFTTQVIFEVTAAQTPPPTYQWQKDGTNITGENSESLTINNPQSTDAGSYRVIVTNSCGSTTSSAATLTFPDPLYAYHDTVTIISSEGYDPDPISIAGAKSGGIGPYTYQWQLNGADIPLANGTSYNPGPLNVAGTYIYRCKVCDVCGTVFMTTGKKIIIEVPLPIELGDFTGVCNNGVAEIKWTTITETNNEYFTLESSSDVKNWNLVTKLKGAGNSNEILHYRYFDNSPNNGLSYYRLTQTDFDGKYEVFTPISVICSSEPLNNIKIYPNPFVGELTIQYTNLDRGKARIRVYDMIGNIISDSEIEVYIGSNTYKLDLDNLGVGLYNVEFTMGEISYHQRVIKK